MRKNMKDGEKKLSKKKKQKDWNIFKREKLKWNWHERRQYKLRRERKKKIRFWYQR